MYPNPPQYIVDAIAAFRNGDRCHVRQTIRLATAVQHWAGELKSSGTSKPWPTVRQHLSAELGGKAAVSRLLAVGELANAATAAGLSVDCIRSQGILFAILPIIRRATQMGIQLPLADVLADATWMTIEDFRTKWRNNTRPKLTRHICVGDVLIWVDEATDEEELHTVIEAIKEKIEAVESSQLFEGSIT